MRKEEGASAQAGSNLADDGEERAAASHRPLASERDCSLFNFGAE